jgi:DNA-binding beta-propeller fold protein YncE
LGCRATEKTETAPAQGYRGLFVLNEGQWTHNNATLSYYNENEDYKWIPDIFRIVNQLPLGDVAHSIYIDTDTLFIVVNNSRMIYKLQLPEFRIIGKLNLPIGASPREMIQTDKHTAFVNSLLDGKVYVFNPITMELLSPAAISVPNYSESMTRNGEQLWVTCGNYPPDTNNEVVRIDIQSKSVDLKVKLPLQNPGPICNVQNKIWVASRGDYIASGSAVSIIDAVNGQLDTVIKVKGSIYKWAAGVDGMLMLTDSGVSHLAFADLKLSYTYISKAQLGAANNDILNGISYDPVRQLYYVANAGYGAVNGKIIILNKEKVILRQLSAGLFPGTIFYYR